MSPREDYLGVLDDRESIFEPDSRFSYCNGGFVVLALLAQRASASSSTNSSANV